MESYNSYTALEYAAVTCYLLTAIVLPPGGCHQSNHEVLCRRFQTTRRAEAAIDDDWAREEDFRKIVFVVGQ